MQNDLTLQLTGQITAESPISYTAPNLDAPERDKNRLPRLGGRLFLTAQSIRSAIRHGATRSVYEVLGKKPGLDDYLLAAQGGVMNAKGGGKTSEADPKSAEDDGAEDGEDKRKGENAKEDKAAVLRMRFAREHNPMLTLFGSMAQGIPGALYCGHAFAEATVAPETVYLIRANDFRRDPELFEALEERALEDFLTMQEQAALRSELKAQTKAVKQQLAKARKGADKSEVERLQAQIQALEDKVKAIKTVSLAMPSNYEVIPQGTVFSHDMTLVGVSPLEVSVFLMGLRDWAAEPFIGGKRFHGLGRIKAQWDVKGRTGRHGPLRAMGRVSFAGDFGDLTVEGDMAQWASDALLREAAAAGRLDLSQASLEALN